MISKQVLLGCPLLLMSVFGFSDLIAEPQCTHVSNTMKTSTGPNRQPTAAQSPNTVSLIADVEYLYWLGKENGNEYASTGNSFSKDVDVTPGKVYGPNGKMHSGFKVGLDAFLGKRHWDLSSQYTYFHGSASGSASGGNTNDGLVALFNYAPSGSSLSQDTFNGSQAGYLAEASSKWKLYFNTVDVDLGYRCHIGRNLWIRPLFGLKGTWQHQRMHVDYTSLSIVDDSLFGQTVVLNKQQLWGLGLRTGAMSQWHFVRHFSLFAAFDFDLMWGRNQSKAIVYDSSLTDEGALGPSVQISNQTYNLHSIVPVIECQAGLAFDWTFDNTLSNLAIFLGWEEQVWFFHNRHGSMIADTSLILQGLTAKIDFSF